MKRLPAVGFALLLALAVASCSKKSTDPSDSNTPRFNAQLLASNEVTAPNVADINGRGTVDVTFHVTRDASQNITAATADFTVNLSGFASGAILTGAHIHPGRSGVNGGIAVPLPLSSGEIVLATGSGSFTKTNVSFTTVDLAQQIINDPGAYYFNVHTNTTPGGAVRGQLINQ